MISENIGFIEYERDDLSQQFVFISNRSKTGEPPQIIAYEILISDKEKNRTVGLT